MNLARKFPGDFAHFQ